MSETRTNSDPLINIDVSPLFPLPSAAPIPLADTEKRPLVLDLGDEDRMRFAVDGYIRLNISSQMPIELIELCLKFYCKILILPLTDKQLQFRKSFKEWDFFLRSLDDCLFSAIIQSANKDHISLIISDDIHSGTSIPELERKMAIHVLLNTDEITQIRRDIKGELELNIEQNVSVDQLPMLVMNDRDFVNHMMISVENGFKFIKHKKGGTSTDTLVVIYENRLYWKKNAEARNKRSRSLRLDKIMLIEVGKEAKPLKHESLNDIPSSCCLTVVVEGAMLNLSAPTEDSNRVRVFASYLKGLRKHAIAVKSALSSDKIKEIRNDIRGDEQMNANINADEMYKIYDILKVNDSVFVRNMMTLAQEGVQFISHKKRGVCNERFVVICNERLYWKINQGDRNQRSRSIHLKKIIQVSLGKITKSLKHLSVADIPPCCCFSVITARASLNLSSPNKDPIKIRIFTSYLKGLRRHVMADNYIQEACWYQ